jgi:hypothetical protein
VYKPLPPGVYSIAVYKYINIILNTNISEKIEGTERYKDESVEVEKVGEKKKEVTKIFKNEG